MRAVIATLLLMILPPCITFSSAEHNNIVSSVEGDKGDSEIRQEIRQEIRKNARRKSRETQVAEMKGIKGKQIKDNSLVGSKMTPKAGEQTLFAAETQHYVNPSEVSFGPGVSGASSKANNSRSQINQQEFMQRIRGMIETKYERAKKNAQYVALPECERSERRSYKNSAGNEQALIDAVFYNPDSDEQSAAAKRYVEQQLGRVLAYSELTSTTVSALAYALKVECLPTRVREHKSGIDLFTGKNAFKVRAKENSSTSKKAQNVSANKRRLN